MAYCEISSEFPGAVARLVEKKDAIYALYRDEIGKLMSPNVVRETLGYFDEFYDRVRTPQEAEKNVFRNCIKPN